VLCGEGPFLRSDESFYYNDGGRTVVGTSFHTVESSKFCVLPIRWIFLCGREVHELT